MWVSMRVYTGYISAVTTDYANPDRREVFPYRSEGTMNFPYCVF